jgi:DNA-binding CsgD family transcriptional regulator
VVYEDQPPASRAAAHGRAADLLLSEGADAERVAAHLLRAPAANNAAHREALERASHLALARGGASAAADYLERALDEVHEAAERAAMLARLGSARLRAGRPEAEQALLEALALADDDDTRSYARSVLAHVCSAAGRYQDALALLQQSVTGHEATIEARADLAVNLLVFASAATAADVAAVQPLVTRILTDANERSPAGRRILLTRAAALAVSRAPVETWRPDLERFVDEVVLSSTPEHTGLLTLAIGGLLQAVLLDLADSVLARWLDATERTGAPLDVMNANAHAALARFHRGRVLDAEAHAAIAEEIAAAAGWHDPIGAAMLVHSLTEQQRFSEAEDVLARQPLGIEAAVRSTASTVLLGARGRLRLALGQFDLAADDLLAAYDRSSSNALRLFAIDALRACGRPDEALRIAEHGVAVNKTTAAEMRAIASRDFGYVRGGEEGLALLADAAMAMDDSPMLYEKARGLFLHGQALRRARRPKEARQPLAGALELAHRLGAWSLESQARQELLAAGSRPRRVARTGTMALTASERRVAVMAADGRSNPDIARALFISRKSVETHLSHVYQKLGISGRDSLASALADGQAP